MSPDRHIMLFGPDKQLLCRLIYGKKRIRLRIKVISRLQFVAESHAVEAPVDQGFLVGIAYLSSRIIPVIDRLNGHSNPEIITVQFIQLGIPGRIYILCSRGCIYTSGPEDC